MGNCASPQYAKKSALSLALNWKSTAKIVHIDGSLQEFKQPIKANLILSQYSNFFLCSSESMYVNCRLPQVADDEELQLGQIYFLMPLSKSHAPLSLQELCALAIKASSALPQPDTGYPSSKTLPYLRGNGQRFCKISIGFDIVGANFRQSGAAG
ncbi:hypothetical protein P3X46_026401 [Hevea brasiliensis]|uniref:DUF4228 domain-containing protein n=1 Tax=Hevea brasiliensis TaxID=3981 RepID=A0ABQ9KY68_HEVBR|nr:uncharacterized protein LOC110664995 [Hevea brasiliensis]KAJ9152893.1 hypothetical protein P3X46_026401 [Hevea brasiliensis]